MIPEQTLEGRRENLNWRFRRIPARYSDVMPAGIPI
jgi:hypothetical protein